AGHRDIELVVLDPLDQGDLLGLLRTHRGVVETTERRHGCRCRTGLHQITPVETHVRPLGHANSFHRELGLRGYGCHKAHTVLASAYGAEEPPTSAPTLYAGAGRNRQPRSESRQSSLAARMD